MDLNEKIREKKLEEIRIFLSKAFPNSHETRETALNLVVENFYDRFYKDIKEANE